MYATIEYFKNIKDTVFTIFEGMTITFSHFLRRPMTIQYPDRIEKPVQETLPLRYRGILEV
ncbi:MAG: NADH-quinone oxidoreductase subunit I, partial [Deltaproteobacteria bacterium]|nr:NADH-quinone oxidoreductase subunit I [Deltaproteobacteria bacterium]